MYRGTARCCWTPPARVQLFWRGNLLTPNKIYNNHKKFEQTTCNIITVNHIINRCINNMYYAKCPSLILYNYVPKSPNESWTPKYIKILVSSIKIIPFSNKIISLTKMYLIKICNRWRCSHSKLDQNLNLN